MFITLVGQSEDPPFSIGVMRFRFGLGRAISSRRRAPFGWMDAMRISRGLFVLAIVGAAALGYTADQLRSSYLRSPFSRSVPSNPSSPSGQLYYVVMPNSEALIDHKKVSANPTKAEWWSSSMPMTREQCEAQLKEHSEWRIAIAGSDAIRIRCITAQPAD